MTDKHPYDFELRLDNRVSTHSQQFRLIPDGSRVLDVGCHSGILGEALRLKKKCVVTGIDYNPAALDVAKARLDDVAQVDLETPGWAGKLKEAGKSNFDVILFGDVLEHTRDPLNILKEAKALLAPDGHAIVSLPNIVNLRVRIALIRGRFEYADSGILDRTHIRFFTLKTARELARDAGYRIVSESYSGYSLPPWLINLFPTLLSAGFVLVVRPETAAG